MVKQSNDGFVRTVRTNQQDLIEILEQMNREQKQHNGPTTECNNYSGKNRRTLNERRGIQRFRRDTQLQQNHDSDGLISTTTVCLSTKTSKTEDDTQCTKVDPAPEIPSSTKQMRRKLSRPDVPLYVPRGKLNWLNEQKKNMCPNDSKKSDAMIVEQNLSIVPIDYHQEEFVDPQITRVDVNNLKILMEKCDLQESNSLDNPVSVDDDYSLLPIVPVDHHLDEEVMDAQITGADVNDQKISMEKCDLQESNSLDNPLNVDDDYSLLPIVPVDHHLDEEVMDAQITRADVNDQKISMEKCDLLDNPVIVNDDNSSLLHLSINYYLHQSHLLLTELESINDENVDEEIVDLSEWSNESLYSVRDWGEAVEEENDYLLAQDQLDLNYGLDDLKWGWAVCQQKQG